MFRTNRDTTANERDRGKMNRGDPAAAAMLLPQLPQHGREARRAAGPTVPAEMPRRLAAASPGRQFRADAGATASNVCVAAPGRTVRPGTTAATPSPAARETPHRSEARADRGWQADDIAAAWAREDVARAVAEIADAAEALRWQEPFDRVPRDAGAELGHRDHPLVWLRVGGMWVSIALAAAGMLGGLALLMR